MDKYEYNVKSDEIKKLYSHKNFEAAASIADEIDWYKVKDNTMINRVADIYENTKQYEKAKEILLIAYERSPLGRQLAYKLTILALRTKNFVEADEFYQDFVEMSPSDVSQYLLKYRIAKAKGEDIEVLIQILEAYVDVEMDERWQYELAKLYHEAGRDDKCVQMCNELEVWFNDGKYVNKAKELKRLVTGVIEEYNKRYSGGGSDEASANVNGNINAEVSDDSYDSNIESSDIEDNGSVKEAGDDVPATTASSDETIPEALETSLPGAKNNEELYYADNAENNSEEALIDLQEYEENSEEDYEEEDGDEDDEEGEGGISEEERFSPMKSLAETIAGEAEHEDEVLRAETALREAEAAAVEAQRAADLARKLVEEARTRVNIIKGISTGKEVLGKGTGKYAGMTLDELRKQLDEEERRYESGEMLDSDSKIEIFEFDKSKEGKGKKIGDELTKTAEIDINEIKLNLSENDDVYNTANIQQALAKSMAKLMGGQKQENAQAFGERASENAELAGVETEDISDDYLDDYNNEPTKRINRDEINRLINENKTKYQTVPLSPFLAQEVDGQIGLAEQLKEDEQIEGQMTIEDVLENLQGETEDSSAGSEAAANEEGVSENSKEQDSSSEAAGIIDAIAQMTEIEDINESADSQKEQSANESAESQREQSTKEQQLVEQENGQPAETMPETEKAEGVVAWTELERTESTIESAELEGAASEAESAGLEKTESETESAELEKAESETESAGLEKTESETESAGLEETESETESAGLEGAERNSEEFEGEKDNRVEPIITQEESPEEVSLHKEAVSKEIKADNISLEDVSKNVVSSKTKEVSENREAGENKETGANRETGQNGETDENKETDEKEEVIEGALADIDLAQEVQAMMEQLKPEEEKDMERVEELEPVEEQAPEAMKIQDTLTPTKGGSTQNIAQNQISEDIFEEVSEGNKIDEQTLYGSSEDFTSKEMRASANEVDANEAVAEDKSTDKKDKDKDSRETENGSSENKAEDNVAEQDKRREKADEEYSDKKSTDKKSTDKESADNDVEPESDEYVSEGHKIPKNYRKLFDDFVSTETMEESIADTLDNLINKFDMDGTSKTNNVIITGSAKTGKTTLGLSIIKAANRGRGRSGRRVAKVKATVLNKRGVTLAMAQILGTDLIIEQAGNLMPNTIIDLMIAMKNYTEEMLIVLEDDKAAIDRMLVSSPDLKTFFNNRLDIEEMEINDMVRIAKEYASSQFYEIDEIGELALYAKLDDISGRNPIMSIEDIQEVIDDAIEHARRFSLGKIFGKMKKNKGDKGVLSEQDFL